MIALSQPRQEEASSCTSSSEDSEGEEPDEGVDSPAVRMMRKSIVFQQEQKQIREEAIKHKRHNFRLPVHIPAC